MRNSRAGWWLATVGAGILTACAESPLAPVPPPEKSVLGQSRAWCDGGDQPMRTAALPAANTPDVSLRSGWPIAGVTVTATYSGGWIGLPFDIRQMMTYQQGLDRRPLACLDAPGVRYSEPDVPEVLGPIEAPDGVDPGWWSGLSPREQRALIKYAEVYMQLYPGTYTSVSSVINGVFRDQLLPLKVRAKVRALDFFGGTAQGELLAGAIYGCLLYRSYATNPTSPFANSEIGELASSLVTAFAESHFMGRPLMGLRFGRNGVFGAGLAAVDQTGRDCGSIAFSAIGEAILVDDPYAPRHTPPRGPGGSGPGDEGGEHPDDIDGNDREMTRR